MKGHSTFGARIVSRTGAESSLGHRGTEGREQVALAFCIIVLIAMENSSSLCPIVQNHFKESESLPRTVVQIGYLEVDAYSCPPLRCVWSPLEPAVYFWADHSRSLALALRFRMWALVKNEDAFDTCGWTEVRLVMLPFWQIRVL